MSVSHPHPAARRRRHAVALLLLPGAVLLASACQPTAEDTRSATEGLPNILSNLSANTWLLDRTDSHPPLDTRAVITLNFSPDHTLNGKSACHDYFGTFSLDGDSLTVRSLDSTARTCTTAAAAADNVYF